MSVIPVLNWWIGRHTKTTRVMLVNDAVTIMVDRLTWGSAGSIYAANVVAP